MKKNYLWLFSIVLLGFIMSNPLWAEEWDLKTCLDLGLKRNPAIQGALNAIEGAEARVKQNQSSYYPNLFAETDYSHYKTSTSITTGSSLSGLNTGPNDLTTYYFGLSQNIYDFGRREYKVIASREDLKTYQWTLKDVRLSVIDSIRQSYYGVLLAQRVVEVRKEDLDRTQEHLKQAQGFYQVGLKAKIDVTQAEVTVITAQKALLQAENDVRQAWVALAAAMGLTQLPGAILKDDLETGPVNWNLEDLKKEALDKDPVLNRLRAVISYWQVQEQGVQREFWPTLTGTAKYGWNNGSNYSNDETWNLGLQLNIPIFSGFQTKEKLAEYRAALSQARANEGTQKLQVVSNLQSQYLNQVLAEKQIEVARESLRRAKENLELAMGRYKAGVGAMLEVTDARTSTVQSETDYHQALYNHIIARYKVERAIGRE
ncbi:MAG: TolC family protein [Deltaproteobacteria bacterium]|nr:TolC family protein [Deltaproteobacteria bacterium]